MVAETAGFSAEAVLRLCAATWQSIELLAIDDTMTAGLTAHLATAEAAVRREPIDYIKAVAAVRLVRYVLVEASDGPIARALADSAARVLGEDVGGLFS